MKNLLSLESSPYLLQHANNPVHWQAWNQSTLNLAEKSQKLILISIGYSACHWCHVMEHESFEDLEVAQTMNHHFINIKVDREERPDVDAIYMKAVQLMTGRGGWPLNVVCLPDGRPVWGGTYFRKNDWINTLERLQEIYLQEPQKFIEYAQKLQEGVNYLGIIDSQENTANNNQELLKNLLEKWQKSFDWEYGGYARAPKFMMPNNYRFLLRYGHQTKNNSLLEYVNLTLTKMAWGGLFDTIYGGFSRYSVDEKWHIPHFEKMLYDNAQLVSLYSDAYKLTKNPLFKEVVEKTLLFVENEWFTEQGGFFSALDADSLDQNNKLEEGAFYVWTKNELEQIITEDFVVFSDLYNINSLGFWEKDHYVLIQNQTIEELAIKHHITSEGLLQKKSAWEKALCQAREKRPKPRLDDKIITSWNALMLKGFIDAYKAFGVEKYLTIALQNASFIEKKLWSSEGNLYHSFKSDKATINGFLEDYAFVIQAFISLFEITADSHWLYVSKNLTDYVLDYFYDTKTGFFRFTSSLDQPLIATHFELEDNVMPSSNAIMCENLLALSICFEHSFYEKVATKMLQKIIPTIDFASAYSNWLYALLNTLENSKHIAICGAESIDYLEQLYQEYLPNVFAFGTTKPSDIAFFKNRFIDNKTIFYLCENKTCNLPEEDFERIKKQLS